ncbi:MAG: hypothetical protein IT168_17410 [Bryobacterales bacterium]|nr:hypothetical protein [Bryobacterales bacterium]
MLVVVGGHSRNIGKTTAMEKILRATPEMRWWAFKVTQHGHGVCSEAGTDCGCAGDLAHPYAIDEETAPSGTDSGRYLGAGAERAFWVRTAMGDLGHAMPALRQLMSKAPNVLVESNSVLNFIVPHLYIVVVNFSVADMKDSARRFLNRADVLVVTGEGQAWGEVPERWLAKPRVAMPDLGKFFASRIENNSGDFPIRNQGRA